MTIQLNWTDNPAAELVDHYNVYQSVDGGMETKIGETVVSQFEVVDPAPGSYYFKVSAVNLAGEGPLSQPVNGPTIPSAPTGLEIVVV